MIKKTLFLLAASAMMSGCQLDCSEDNECRIVFDGTVDATYPGSEDERPLNDTELPAVAITTSGGTVESEDIILVGTASDNVGITDVLWRCIAGCTGNGAASGAGMWMTTAIQLSEGANTIEVSARDAADNVGTDAVTINRSVSSTDNQIPQISITSPSATAPLLGSVRSIDIVANVTDDSAIDSVQWACNEGCEGTGNAVRVSLSDNEWRVDNLQLTSGDVEVDLIATDVANNMSSSTLNLSRSTGGAGYVLPIGIPEPSFGLRESHTMYEGQFFEEGGFDYRDAGNGPYTHYVDNTAANCDDSNAGGFGTEDEPRCTITTFRNPIDLPEGSVMEIHGGPYLFDPGWKRMYIQGTEDKPIFVRGIDNSGSKVRLSRVTTSGSTDDVDIRLEGQYYIFDNLDFYGGVYPVIRDEVARIEGTPSHIAFRNLEVQGDQQNQIAAGAALSSGPASDVVIFNNHIHHNVRVDNNDLHGTSAGGGSERTWILNNHIHHNSGDAFQALDFRFLNGAPPPRYVYIGGNIMHEDRENGVDLKTIRDVIVSQNTIYGYTSSGTSNGDAIIVGSNGVGETLDDAGPNNAWFLFNNVYGNTTGVRFEGVFTGTFIGNYIHDNERNGVSLDIKVPSRNVRLIGNSFANQNEGIHHHWLCGDPLQIQVADNLFYNHDFFHLGLASCTAERTALTNNLFWQDGSPIYMATGYNTYNFGSGAVTDQEALARAESVRFAVDSDIVASLNTNGLSYTGNGNLADNPSFVSATNLDIRSDSAAINQTTEHPVYQEFEDLYGLDIRYDFLGRPRPANGENWDIGAYEFQSVLNN